MERGKGVETVEAREVARLPEGKDELNLAEFPLCSIADRSEPGRKSFSFQDRIWDAHRGEMISRHLTVTGSAEHGLPTAMDDEVLLGLIQLTKLRDFAEREVRFTRYQLIRLLGWREESKSYERIEQSLNRWVGVALFYKNAWWCREQKCWVDEKFHVLDNVSLLSRETLRRRRLADSSGRGARSHFTWNEVLFRSFKAGNLKGLDFDFYRSLDSAIAKRLYRFLDKRFFHRARCEFDLREISWEHIGLSRNYDVANLKRKLRPAIAELEGKGFLKGALDEERFRKVTCGEWRVLFERRTLVPARSAPAVLQPESELLKQALIERGVTPSTAQKTMATAELERVRSQLEVFDWMMAHRDRRISKNPAGFLVSSIRSEYATPKGFVSREDRAEEERRTAERRQRTEERARAEVARREAQERARREAIDEFWRRQSADERRRLEAEALREARTLERELVEQGGAFAEGARQVILDAYALKSLAAV